MVIVGEETVAVTVKFDVEVAFPTEVVTAIFPVVAPVGTVAVIWVALFAVKVAVVPLKETADAPFRFVPVTTTLVPTGPLAGRNEETVGTAGVGEVGPELLPPPQEAKAIAKDLGVKPEEVVEMETRLTGRDVSIDPTPGDEENSVSPIAYLTDSDDEPGKILERKQNAQNRTKGLNTALAKLDDRSRRIIEARWLREDDSTSTLQELADEYGVSAERIRQIESKAMKTIRGQMAHAM